MTGEIIVVVVTGCKKCLKPIDPLEVFPGGICVECFAETAEGKREVSGEELVAMWGGKTS